MSAVELGRSIDAHTALPGTMTFCSRRGGWRSLLLRAYEEPPSAEQFTTAPTDDQLIVLVTSGAHRIESLRKGEWSEALYSVGSLGMTAAGEAATLRWREGRQASTLQLHLPGSTIRAAAEAIWGLDATTLRMPNHLFRNDPTVQELMLSLHRAAQAGVPDVYAETAAAFLAMHLVRNHAGAVPTVAVGREEGRLRKVNIYMQENFHRQIALEDLAREAGFSRFHLLRLFKKTYGETPYRRLTRMRIEHGCLLLSTTTDTVTQIAFSCGFENSSHFASTFRRFVGVSPSHYRKSPA